MRYCNFAYSVLAFFRMGMSGSVSFQFGVWSVCAKNLLWHSFATDSNLSELRSSSELHKQRVGLQTGIGTIIVFDGASQQSQSAIVLPTVREHGSDPIPRFRIISRKRDGCLGTPRPDHGKIPRW
jgi:hypothetical protein